MTELKPVLSVKNLNVRFETSGSSIYAVNNVDFEILSGETLAVVGESGCGKTATMLSILGLLPKNITKISGNAFFSVNDRNIDLLSLSQGVLNRYLGKHIGMIFQDPMRSLNPVLTVGEQICDSLSTHLGYSGKKAFNTALELLDLVNIPDPKKRIKFYPHMLSGGMKQRVMIAIAISCSPQILIADEPTTALDVNIQSQIIELISRLQKELKMAVIWITHDLGVVAGIAQRVMVMYGGTVTEIAPVDELYDNPQHPYTKALLNSIPNVAHSKFKRLINIPGIPPDLLKAPEHCQFAWRCEFALNKCWKCLPAFYAIGKGHRAKCYYDLQN